MRFALIEERAPRPAGARQEGSRHQGVCIGSDGLVAKAPRGDTKKAMKLAFGESDCRGIGHRLAAARLRRLTRNAEEISVAHGRPIGPITHAADKNTALANQVGGGSCNGDR